MRAFFALLLVASAWAAGCAAPAPEAPVRDGPIGGVSLTPPPEDVMRGGASGVREPARDPEAPPVTRGGAPSHAMSLLARERVGENERHLCGGAVVATLPGAYPDGIPEVVYVESVVLLDPAGHEWITDLYADPAQPENETRSVWVANVGGGAFFRRDEGAYCAASMHEGRAYNVLLFADVEGELEVRLQPATRPSIPRERVYP